MMANDTHDKLTDNFGWDRHDAFFLFQRIVKSTGTELKLALYKLRGRRKILLCLRKSPDIYIYVYSSSYTSSLYPSIKAVIVRQ